MTTRYIIKFGNSYYNERMNNMIGGKSLATKFKSIKEAVNCANNIKNKYKLDDKEIVIIKVTEEEISLDNILDNEQNDTQRLVSLKNKFVKSANHLLEEMQNLDELLCELYDIKQED